MLLNQLSKCNLIFECSNIAHLAKVKVMKTHGGWEDLQIPSRYIILNTHICPFLLLYWRYKQLSRREEKECSGGLNLWCQHHASLKTNVYWATSSLAYIYKSECHKKFSLREKLLDFQTTKDPKPHLTMLDSFPILLLRKSCLFMFSEPCCFYWYFSCLFVDYCLITWATYRVWIIFG